MLGKLRTQIKKNNIGDLAYVAVLAPSLYALFLGFKFLGFSENTSKGLSLLLLLGLIGMFILGLYRYQIWRSRRRYENEMHAYLSTRTDVSLDQRLKNIENMRKEFDQLIQKNIKEGSFTHQQWEDAKAEARNIEYSPEVFKRHSEERYKALKRVVVKVIFYVIAIIAFYIIGGEFLKK